MTFILVVFFVSVYTIFQLQLHFGSGFVLEQYSDDENKTLISYLADVSYCLGVNFLHNIVIITIIHSL